MAIRFNIDVNLDKCAVILGTYPNALAECGAAIYLLVFIIMCIFFICVLTSENFSFDFKAT